MEAGDFLRDLAAKTIDGECVSCEPRCEDDVCDEPFVMENDDAVSTLTWAIESAREIVEAEAGAREAAEPNVFPVILTTKEGDHTQLVVVSHPTLDAKAFEEAFEIAELRASQNVEDSSLDEDVFPILAADGWSIISGDAVEVYY